MFDLSENQKKTIDAIRAEVQKILASAEAGHDWWHIHRVYINALSICENEVVDQYVVLISALLHDIADAKFHNGNESIGPALAFKIMKSHHVDKPTTEHVVNIIENMSFKNSLEDRHWTSKEMEVVQDADRLDAIGAIGIARAFSYGGFKGRAFFDPSITPAKNLTKEAYKKSKAPTINHFYEKLLLLKEKMNTPTGRQLAQDRHQFMIEYLKQFYKEWYGSMEIPHDFSQGL